MEFPGQRCLFGIFKKGKYEIVDSTCVMKKILRDERNHKDEVCYRRFNRYEEETFDHKLDYDDIEAGMEIMLWWSYQEAPSQPEGGRFRKVHVIETEVQKDDQDDEEETMQKTFRDAGMIGGHFRDAKDDLLSEYLVDFLKSYDEKAEFEPQKNRKRELKSILENLANDFDDQKSRLKKKRPKLSRSIAFKIELANFNSKIMKKQTPPSDEIEKDNDIETESKKEENKSKAEVVPSGEKVQEDRQPEPIEATNG